MTEGSALASAPTELVLLIHGTFAGDEADEGVLWWQTGSDVWSRIRHVLPPSAALADVFHWGEGPNSYRGRTAAASALLARLLDMERRGQPYHLVGHSHGGSVVWKCLKQATYECEMGANSAVGRQLLELRNLKSWTTVGTPFVEFGSNLFGTPRNRTHAPLAGYEHGRAPRRLVSTYPALVRLLDFLFWAFIVFAFGFYVLVGFAVFKDMSAGVEVRASTLALVPVVSAGYLVIVFVCGTYVAKFSEALQLSWESLLSDQAKERFATRWLGLVSKNDEAIAALKRAVDLELDIIPKRGAPDSVFYSDKALSSLRWLRRVLRPLYNLFIPLGNRFISTQLSNSALGSDRPGARAVSVTANPFSPDEHPLPDQIDAKILALANARAQELVPELRSLLYAPDGSGLLRKDSGVDPAAALVHTTYFDVDEVIDLIGLHVRHASRGNWDEGAADGFLSDWIAGFKRDIVKHMSRGALPPSMKGKGTSGD